MFGQSFAPHDLVSILTLVVLEALLSADNALVLAIMVRHLDEAERQKALLFGLGGAFVFRLVAIVFATLILEQWWLQALGGGYLLFLAIRHLAQRGHDESKSKGNRARGGFWATVVAVELTDIAFALDSVLASIAFITTRTSQGAADVQEDKIWVVVVGAMIGIVLLRFAAAAFTKVLDRFPILNLVAYVLVAWVGLKLVSHAFHSAHRLNVVDFQIPAMSEPVFWTGLALILVVGVTLAILKREPKPAA